MFCGGQDGGDKTGIPKSRELSIEFHEKMAGMRERTAILAQEASMLDEAEKNLGKEKDEFMTMMNSIEYQKSQQSICAENA